MILTLEERIKTLEENNMTYEAESYSLIIIEKEFIINLDEVKILINDYLSDKVKFWEETEKRVHLYNGWTSDYVKHPKYPTFLLRCDGEKMKIYKILVSYKPEVKMFVVKLK